MRIIFIFCCLTSLQANGQLTDSIVAELKEINNNVSDFPCKSGRGMAVSNRALNLFLLDKTSYVSESSDLSLYTNYVTFNSFSGTLTINHNFHALKGNDELIKELFSVGVKASIAAPFAVNYINSNQSKAVGLTINNKWLGKTKTYLTGCNANSSIGKNNNQKELMDAFRIEILQKLITDLERETATFEKGNTAADSVTTNFVKKYFYEELSKEYHEKFASLQAEVLTKTKPFNRITSSWTSISLYVPLVTEKFNTATSYATPILQKRTFESELSVSNTRFLEYRKRGRFFFTITGCLKINNAKQSNLLTKNSFADYKNSGGTDTLKLEQLKIRNIFIGQYSTFITPVIAARTVYFPNESHVGVSILIEQHLGKYNALNGRIGIPIVLINKQRLPLLNIELQATFFDISNTAFNDVQLRDKTSIAINAGIPFSRMIF